MLWVALVIAGSLAAGHVAERRAGERASALARRALKLLLYGVTPPVAFLNIVHLEITPDIGGGVVLGWIALVLAGAAAWAIGRFWLRLPDPSVGALVNSSLQGNTGYLGLPLCVAVLAGLAAPAALAPLLLLALAAPFIDLPPAYLLLAAMPAGINGLTVAHVFGLDLRFAAASIAWTTGVAVGTAAALTLAV